ncbi:uncharacterized protein LOC121856602 [Homarus americanus]|uniref:uncharacterized protein LOC121856602 n=1 Tax=Homarus americanus TaxID=6706 RepID=UPI001C45BA69|nr:uncharacterized protein LOC121856602 [Homarus americanus]
MTSPYQLALLGMTRGQESDEDTNKPLELLEGYYSYIKVTPLQSVFSYGNSTEPDGGHGGAPLGLALLIAMVSVALAIAIIALLIRTTTTVFCRCHLLLKVDIENTRCISYNKRRDTDKDKIRERSNNCG